MLNEAGIEKADVVVAATQHDVENLSCAILAKSLIVPKVIARMRDVNYENAYKVAGIDRIVRVADLMVDQILLDIENPQVRRVATIGGGRANIFMVVIPEGAEIDGWSIKDITEQPSFPQQCTFAGMYRPSDCCFTIPRGDDTVTAGDELFLLALPQAIQGIVDLLTSGTGSRSPKVAV